jgi:hypothetical protein
LLSARLEKLLPLLALLRHLPDIRTLQVFCGVVVAAVGALEMRHTWLVVVAAAHAILSLSRHLYSAHRKQ